MDLITSFRKEIIEQWRTSRLLVVLVVLGFFGMSSPLIAKFMPDLFKTIPGGEVFSSLIPAPTIKDAIEQYLKNIGQFSIMLAIFLSMGSVSQEKERGTAVLMLVKPLGRGTFLLAKFLALALTFLISMAVAGALGYFYTGFLFSTPDAWAWLGMNGLLWAYCLVYIAITLLASTLLRSQAAAAGAGFVVLLLVAGFGVFPNISPYLPSQLAGWAAELFILPGTEHWPALAVSLAVILACLLVAWLAFRRQEL